MKLCTFNAGGATRLGHWQGDLVIDLQAAWRSSARAAGGGASEAEGVQAVPPAMVDLLRLGDQGLARARQAVAHAEARRAAGDSLIQARPEPLAYPATAVTLLPPAPRPEKIIGVGLNYRDHCLEMGRELPTDIRTFAMFANTIIGHNDAIVLPTSSRQMDWEAELVVVIGKSGKYIPVTEALNHIAGYTIGNDVSARDHQASDPATTRGKSGDTHAPIGPWIVTTDEITNPGELDIELRLNGVVKQSSNTRELVFGVPTLVSFLSQYFTLQSGDLIFTGTPAGVGAGRNPPEWLKPGDRIDISIAGIGVLTNHCVAETA